MEYKVEIFEDGYWNDVTATIINPIAISELLDTGLDTANIVMWNVQRNVPYQPFTKVKITLTDESRSNIYRYFIAIDDVGINNFGDGGFDPQSYTHNISLIEPTKILERINVDNLTVTQSKLIGFGGDFEPVQFTMSVTGDSDVVDIINQNFQYVEYTIGSPLRVGEEVYFPPIQEYYLNYVYLSDADKNGLLYPWNYNEKIINSSFGKYDFGSSIKLTTPGNFFIEITFPYETHKGLGTATGAVSLRYEFTVVEADADINTEKTITSELQRILNVTPLRRLTSPYYELKKIKEEENLPQIFDENMFFSSYEFNNSTGNISVSNPVNNINDLVIGTTYYTLDVNNNKNIGFETIVAKNVNQNRVNVNLILYQSTEINSSPPFVLDNAIAEKYKDVRCPEFTFTKQTLWEALLQFGDYIHAIPRLISDENENWNVITFDFLGLQKNTNLINEVYNTSTQNVENYTTELDSYVSNLINSENLGDASIIEPAYGLYRGVRTDGEYIVNNDNVIFQTDYPIYELKKVMLKFGELTADITNNCYETNEYRLLSDFTSNYPSSKKYALEYTIGEKNIFQLQRQIRGITNENVKNDYSIVNIANYHGFGITEEDIINLEYQIEYIPIISNRVKQRKVNYKEYNEKSSLYSNQSANMVSSVAYGENLKGDVLRLSNLEISKTFRFYNLYDIPNIGDTVGNYYIAQINLQCYRDYINATIQFSKDFNRLSKFIGITSFNRMYEVSERQTIERCVNQSVNISIDFQNNNSNPESIVTNEGKLVLVKTFVNYQNTKPSIMLMSTYRKDKSKIQDIALPLNVLAMGNSIIFSCKFEDNYSAGTNLSEPLSDFIINKYTQTYVPYCTELGNFEYLTFKISTPTSNNNINDLAKTLPRATNLNLETPVIDTNNLYNGTNNDEVIGALIVEKENREIPNISVQLHYVSTIPEIVLGYFLTHKSGFIKNADETNYIYALPYKINKFEKILDLTNATQIKSLSLSDFNMYEDSPYFSLKPFVVNIDCKSIAICNDAGELLLGINKSYFANDLFNELFFTLQ